MHANYPVLWDTVQRFYSLRPSLQFFSFVGTGLPGLNLSTKQGLMCLAQGHNAVVLVRLEPATPRSQVKHSTTEPLRSQSQVDLTEVMYV